MVRRGSVIINMQAEKIFPAVLNDFNIFKQAGKSRSDVNFKKLPVQQTALNCFLTLSLLEALP